MKKIIYYQNKNWKSPLVKFLKDLSKKQPKLLAKILYKIDLLEQSLLSEKDVKFIQDKIFELRISFSWNISRVLYFCYDDEKVILLNWFLKKQNKLPQKYLLQALEFKKDYMKNSL